VKSWDVIIIGAGIIGLSLAVELRKSGAAVLVIDKGEPGREASWAAGGMLADFALEIPAPLQPLATASAQMYPHFVHQLEADSGMKIDLRSRGTLFFLHPDHDRSLPQSHPLPAPLSELEPALKFPETAVLYLQERSVDPRHLVAAAIAAAHHRGVQFISDDPVQTVEIKNGKAAGVRTNKTHFSAAAVVNCAGAWAGQIGCVGRAFPSTRFARSGPALPAQPERGATGVPQARPERSRRVQAEQWPADLFTVPTRPVKGQMLSVALPKKNLVRHVVRAPNAYLIPRSDGRLVIGATLEEAGFNKQTVPQTIQNLRQAAIDLVPALANAAILETWAGLRPGTPDALPILGETDRPGYFVATGHFRDGILLAPVTARVMGQVIAGQKPEFDLRPFAAERFRT
jgi:glycine oxidase